MKGMSPATSLEIDIEPFIIELDSPCSTAPPSPTKDRNPSRYWPEPLHWKSPLAAIQLELPSPAANGSAPDFWPECNDVELLDLLFSPIEPSLTLFEILIRHPSPSARAAILYYLPFAPVVQRDIPALVPALLDDEEVMLSLATNIAYYYARDFIAEWELEYLLMEILSCRNREGVYGVDMKVVQFYHLTLWQIQRYRQHYVPRSTQNEQARNQKQLRDNIKHRDKQWKRKRAGVRKSLDFDWRM